MVNVRIGDRSVRRTKNPIFSTETIIDKTVTNIIYAVKATYEKEIAIPADAFGRPPTNPPTVEEVDNLTVYAFTLNSDKMTFKFPVPSDYESGPLMFRFIWTNDGGSDDCNRWVRWRIDYRVVSEYDLVSGTDGSIAVDDLYPSPNGRVECRSQYVSIPVTSFMPGQCVYIKITAVTPPSPALTCKPRLIGLCLKYKATTIYFPP